MYLIFKHALNISERKYQTFHLELNKKLWSNLIKADLNWSTIIYSYHNFLTESVLCYVDNIIKFLKCLCCELRRNYKDQSINNNISQAG